MKGLFLILLFSISSFVFKTNEVNQLKKEVKELYADKKYLKAIKLYTRLEVEYKIHEEPLLYNHANACYKSAQFKTALKYYKIIADDIDPVLASEALNQMGIIACRSKQLKQGKFLFIESLRKNPSNTHAILNLEWALTQEELFKNKSNSKQEKDKRKSQKNKPDSNANQQKNDPSGDQEESNSLRSQQHKNKYMDINKARLLLESMKNSEKQYIQQHPIHNKQNANEPAW